MYSPGEHKNVWRGRERRVWIGPAAQQILAPFDPAYPSAYYFSPRRSRDAWEAARRAVRKTPLYRSHLRRYLEQKRASPKRSPRERYTTDAYGKAVVKAAERAGVPGWSPNQLRHLYATEMRAVYGLEAAQVLLGHARADVTQVYAEWDNRLAERVAAEIG